MHLAAMSFPLQLYQFVKLSILTIAYHVLTLIPNFIIKPLKTKDSTNNILVFRAAALGDFIMTLPALNLLRRCYPNCRIVLLTIQSASQKQREKVATYTGASNMLPWLGLAYPHLIDDAIIMDTLNLKSLWRDLRPRVSELNPQHCFLLTDPAAPGMGRLKKMALLRYLGVTCPIYGWRDGSSISRMRQAQFNAGLFRHHVFGPLRSVLESPNTAEFGSIKVEFDARISSSALGGASNLWEKHHLSNKTVIGIAPGSVQPHKRWPLNNFAKVCEVLLENENIVILVIGTPNDESLGDQLSRIEPTRVINLAGKVSILEVAAVLQRCALLVGNDGGSMHLGDAVGCKVISIVPGIEYPISIEPFHNISNAVRHPVKCAPCYSFVKCPEGHNQCMGDLPVSDVLEKINQVLDRPMTAEIQPQVFHIQRKYGGRVSIND